MPKHAGNSAFGFRVEIFGHPQPVASPDNQVSHALLPPMNRSSDRFRK